MARAGVVGLEGADVAMVSYEPLFVFIEVIDLSYLACILSYTLTFYTKIIGRGGRGGRGGGRGGRGRGDDSSSDTETRSSSRPARPVGGGGGGGGADFGKLCSFCIL